MGYAIMIPNVSFADAGLGTVTPVTNVPLTSLSISGDDTVSGETASYSAIFTPANATDKDIVWSIESGSDYASINSTTGELTIKEGADASTVVVKVTSVNNADIYATKEISITYVAPQAPLLTIEKTFGSADDIIVTDYNLGSTGLSEWFVMINADCAENDNAIAAVLICDSGTSTTNYLAYAKQASELGTMSFWSVKKSTQMPPLNKDTVMRNKWVYIRKKDGVISISTDDLDWTAVSPDYVDATIESPANLMIGGRKANGKFYGGSLKLKLFDTANVDPENYKS